MGLAWRAKEDGVLERAWEPLDTILAGIRSRRSRTDQLFDRAFLRCHSQRPFFRNTLSESLSFLTMYNPKSLSALLCLVLAVAPRSGLSAPVAPGVCQPCLLLEHPV